MSFPFSMKKKRKEGEGERMKEKEKPRGRLSLHSLHCFSFFFLLLSLLSFGLNTNVRAFCGESADSDDEAAWECDEDHCGQGQIDRGQAAFNLKLLLLFWKGPQCRLLQSTASSSSSCCCCCCSSSCFPPKMEENINLNWRGILPIPPNWISIFFQWRILYYIPLDLA